MAVLLIYDHDNTHADPEKDYRGCYKKGYVAEVFDDGKSYVNPPQPPFLILLIPGVTKAQVESYMAEWRRVVNYTIVQRSVSLDGWRLDLKATNPGASGRGDVKLAKVQQFIEQWGGAIVGIVDKAVRFDISIASILKSFRFWGLDISRIVFNELDYNRGSGVHRMSADYSALSKPPDAIAPIVTEKGATIVSNAGATIVFDIGRDITIQRAKDEVQQVAEETICRRQQYLDPALADLIIANGRVMTMTAAEVTAYVRDRMAE